MNQTATKGLVLLLLLALIVPAGVWAQGLTTAALNGRVLDNNKQPLIGANIMAVHQPSGTTFGINSRSDGRYNISGMRIGGPYTITARFVGHKTEKIENIYLTLGQDMKIDFILPQESIDFGQVVTTAERDPLMSASRTGAATTISTQTMQMLPTISQRIEDFARLTPQYNPSGYGFSFAGQDNRMNNVTVDGSYFNNSFGLSGQPGDRTGVAPISLEAIEQLQINIAPYDVRQGNFVGAGVNTVTKSGTNEFSGSIYGLTRDQSLVGTKAQDLKFDPGTFSYNRYGARLGGPIIKNKLFFFVDAESDKLTQPGTTYTARTDASQAVAGMTTRVLASDLDALSAYLKKNFNYETGPYQGYDHETPALRFIAKIDYNLNNRNKLSLRYNHLNSDTDVLLSNSSSLGYGTRRSNSTGLNFQNSNYKIKENIRSIVGEWNAMIGANMANNLIIGYTYNDESRDSRGELFPMVDILESGSVYTTFGFEPFTPNNELRYKTFQLQDTWTIYGPKHNWTFGASLERYSSENVFYPGSQGIYVYNSLADFYTDANDYLANPNRTVSPVKLATFQKRWINIPGMEKPVQPLKVWYTGIYGQDEMQIHKNVRLTAGLRLDVPFFEKTGFDNVNADTTHFLDENGDVVQYKTDKLPDANIHFSPRLGFNWDVKGDRSTQVRGGTGIFTGKPAYVWISNQIGNTGMLTGFEKLTNTTARPFNPNPHAYEPASVTGAPASSYELALTDPNFKFPQIWRSNLGVDQKLPWGLIGTAEVLYGRDVNGVYYINANLPKAQTNFNGADNRPRYTSNRINNTKGNVVENAIVLKNQNVGYSYNIVAAIEKPFSNGLYGKVAYSYGVSKNTVDPGSIASGSFTANAINWDPNNPVNAYSATSAGSRVLGALSYRFEYLKLGATTVALYLDGFSVGNASYIFSGDLNGDGATGNDLLYIHKDKSEMNFQEYKSGGVTFTAAQQADAWDAYIEQDKYLSKHRGEYAGRNAVRLPMVYRADLSISQDLFTNFLGKRNTLQFRVDFINFTNMINKNWGVSKKMVSSSPLVVPKTGAADAEGKATYTLRSFSGKLMDHTYDYNATLSDVYRVQFGLRYNFN
ncbi:MAG TPA: carboxypeptidase regulatory-like domain-containing protein [bacterium]|nr:carboxypeptidase regulatory-like domain-containing protein [bacterium]HPR86663.1 carboxypeptidase regulatory-like domain-containing protein [bacterium]